MIQSIPTKSGCPCIRCITIKSFLCSNSWESSRQPNTQIKHKYENGFVRKDQFNILYLSRTSSTFKKKEHANTT